MSIEKFVESAVTHLLTITPEGMILYVCGAISITWVHLYHKKDVVKGLKGQNGLWEAPEWIIYQFTWLFPHMVMADQFLGLHASDFAWWFMLGLLLFALTGRFGLEWLLAFKSGASKVEESTTTIQQKNTTVTKEES